MAEPLWTLVAVTVPGRGAPRLERLDLEVAAGVTAILGPSGAGKTTLCDVLVGFTAPAAGRVVRHVPPGAAAGRLPLFWSPGDGLWPHLDVAAHLDAVAPARPKRPPAELLAAFALDRLAHASPAQLSAGERERLGVARALASEAAVLVLDEPFAHVDAGAAAACWRTLMGLARGDGTALVYTTHAPERVVGHADAVVCLDQGRLRYHGAVDELYHRPPDPAAAACLGEADWLSDEDAAAWFPGAAGGCIRPERVLVTAADDGPALVRSAAFHGALGEIELELRDGRRRRFLHRPSRPLHAGERVAVRLLPPVDHAAPAAGLRATPAPGARLALGLLAAFLALAMAGCGAAPPPTLAFSSEQTWILPPVAANQPAPRGLGALGADQVLVLDTAGRVLVYDGAGALVRQWRMPASDVGRPEGVVELRDGRIAVADTHYHRVVLFGADGAVAGMLGSEGTGPGQFLFPVGVATDPAGHLYVSEYGGNDRVQKFAADGTLLAGFGGFGTEAGKFQRPQGLAWHDGRLYVADAMNNRVQVFGDDGRFIGVLGGEHAPELRFPYGVAIGPDRTLTVVEYSGDRVTRLGLDGALLGRYGRAGRGDGEFSTPWGMTVDRRGRVWVADTGNRRLVELVP